VAPLPQEEALNGGVAIVSEILVFFVAGSILVYEYQVNEVSNAAKAAAAAKEKNDAKQQLEDRLSAIDTQLLVLADRLQTLEKAQAQQEASAAVRELPTRFFAGASVSLYIVTAVLLSRIWLCVTTVSVVLPRPLSVRQLTNSHLVTLPSAERGHTVWVDIRHPRPQQQWERECKQQQ
jgi:Flp pilus assembly protein TadB